MDFRISSDLEKELKRIKTRDFHLLQQIQKQLLLFKQDHTHPSLRIHKLSGNLKNLWSISIDRNIRMLFIIDDEEALFFDIGTHNQVYR
ncbi:hypothetical protein A3J20_07190 [Candidatus Gottesmanbacteria bacterium RIFCSPLOWO2_02_FULL_42_29]|uniref:Toxin YoeB n=1 Tax=Candidatus Gottesmanbacteria bacterium RIFCSPLOWO2_01_FULL_42_22 TaxID=1798391 RepID=A0A1F6BA97_9BACT|nr:MAG: hypothetical protein UV46_C0042G0012 [Candidatus Gottesmanbacteria bacterium GW2011_GWC2_42_8]OGG10269.1 MAG: hypothetical protein A2781_01065 [Candidatus Gottesmanbacteria bacterium RIFCSPHIGHO2_01_FULL_42_27]OGG20300.1 MAG: hypothetical protein A3E72_04190 [Candidatus Gottesmanbacteria bacterium RIFCSPHIGHO2_12_FULL_43_26]OGG33437.1 MAG: hypothetical protein A2968_02605 [Candidatus Gottesmanbacteria bacterium RIFCSPLOWO2_01_FULL_42_22]OGG33841.1 MAG: hypothetical protein A3G68_04685 [